MTAAPTCSVVICSYNYERYVRQAIESALAQQDVALDVVVVDDGSVDGSPLIVREYADRVHVVSKENGGQGSALNAGFAASCGEVVLFLDADDLLEEGAARAAAQALAGGAVKAHWPLRVIDAAGRPTGSVFPAVPLPSGDLRAEVAERGPGVLHFAPTSGNAFARSFLDEVLPLAEAEYRYSPDKYLAWLAVATGPVVALDEPLSRYRKHETNYMGRGTTDEQIAVEAGRSEHAFPDVARRLGLGADAIERWRHHDWWCQLDRACALIANHVPEGSPVALLDDFTWAARGTVGGREVRQFAAAGPPDDEADLVAEAGRLQREGVRYLVVADPARWWLEHYGGFAAWLDERAPVLVEAPGLQLRRLPSSR